MTKDEAKRVRIGDKLVLDPMWNATTSSRHRKFADVVVVNEIILRPSQTGINFSVEPIGKDPMVLDAGWFSMPERVE